MYKTFFTRAGFIALAISFLAACSLFPAKDAVPPAPAKIDTSSFEAAAKKATDAQNAVAAATEKVEAQAAAAASRASAYTREANDANTRNPDGNPKTAVDVLTKEAMKDQPTPAPADALAASKLKAALLAGQVIEAEALLKDAQTNRDASQKLAVQAQLEAEQAKAAAKSASSDRDAQVADIKQQSATNEAGIKSWYDNKAAADKIASDQRHQDDLNALEVAGQKKLQLLFVGLAGITGVLAAIFFVIAYFDMDSPKLWGAGALCTGLALENGALATFVGQKVFLLIAEIGGSVLLVGLFVFLGFYLWTNRKQVAKQTVDAVAASVAGAKATAFDEIHSGLNDLTEKAGKDLSQLAPDVASALKEAMSPATRVLVKQVAVDKKAAVLPVAPKTA